MAITVHGPREIEFEESYGAAMSMRVVYFLEGVTGATASAKIAAALSASGVPAYLSSPTGYTNLKCVRREVKPLEGSSSQFNVICHYVSVGDLETGWYFRGQASLSQESRTTDYGGVPISVSHTFPDDDPDYPSQTVSQGGTISVLIPQYEITGSGIKATDRPEEFEQKYIGRINSSSWRGGAAGLWKCTNISYRPHDISTSPKKWMFTVTFSYKQTGWGIPVAFTDPRTGKPPENLVSGVGFKSVSFSPSADFNSEFPSI